MKHSLFSSLQLRIQICVVHLMSWQLKAIISLAEKNNNNEKYGLDIMWFCMLSM